MEAINTNKNSLKISEDTIMYLQKSFLSFDIDKLDIEYSGGDSEDFQLFYAYSYDNNNFSDYFNKDNFKTDNISVPLFISVRFVRNVSDDLDIPLTIHQKKNVDDKYKFVEIKSVKYDKSDIEFHDESQVKFKTFYKIIDEFPRWNFYDNQQINIQRWKAQCNAMAEMYGHTVIYFKTEPVPEEIRHTFRNYTFRNVVDIKKLHVVIPDNELPHDRNIYTEWDMPLADDFIVHIVKEKFEDAFGLNVVPVEKDYLYFPLINKMFRISAQQPNNGFMGQIGWWECALAKYEDDESISVDDELKDIMEGMPGGNEALESIDTVSSDVFNEIQDHLHETLNDVEKIDVLTIEEKKTATNNFQNGLVDSTHHVSLKETEKLREFYDKRLKIVSVSPDSTTMNIPMYNNSEVVKRTVAMQYTLKDYTIKNKFALRMSKGFSMSFNFILLNNFTGEMFDLLVGDLPMFSIKCYRNKLAIVDNRNNVEFKTSLSLEHKEFYNILVEYNEELKQFAFKVFKLENKEKTLEYQNIYINDDLTTAPTIDFEKIQMYGGSYLSSEIIFKINDNKIIQDNVNPLLKMKQY